MDETPESCLAAILAPRLPGSIRAATRGCRRRHEGWICLPEQYDDGGFTGGNLERPALRRLLADIEAGKIDCVVVYKVDRLSRSLLDFARIMEVFEQRNVSFVSVTQQFNTATSMGRLVLNVLLSFAQFEREIIGERIRDKIAAQRRRGKWGGGVPVLGYDVDRSISTPQTRGQCGRGHPDPADLQPIHGVRFAATGRQRTGAPWLVQQDLDDQEEARPWRAAVRQVLGLLAADEPALHRQDQT